MSVATRSTTALGTPRAGTWDDAWFAFVEEVEERKGHRICGAHAPDNEPCELQSTHPNGRCRFHGGHPRIGAQPGNTNALIHGLYSRRIRTCESTCPIWDRCPMAGKDVADLPPRKRPQCVYERAAFDAFRGIDGETIAPEWEGERTREPWVGEHPPSSPLEGGDGPAIGTHQDMSVSPAIDPHEDSGFRRNDNEVFSAAPRETSPAGEDASPPGASPAREDGRAPGGFAGDDDAPGVEPDAADPVEDTAGLLYAMLQRAAIHVAAHDLTDHTYAGGERYTLSTKKISPGVNALLYIARELRAWLRLRPETPPDAPPEDREIGLPDIMAEVLRQTDGILEASLVRDD